MTDKAYLNAVAALPGFGAVLYGSKAVIRAERIADDECVRLLETQQRLWVLQLEKAKVPTLRQEHGLTELSLAVESWWWTRLRDYVWDACPELAGEVFPLADRPLNQCASKALKSYEKKLRKQLDKQPAT